MRRTLYVVQAVVCLQLGMVESLKESHVTSRTSRAEEMCQTMRRELEPCQLVNEQDLDQPTRQPTREYPSCVEPTKLGIKTMPDQNYTTYVVRTMRKIQHAVSLRPNNPEFACVAAIAWEIGGVKAGPLSMPQDVDQMVHVAQLQTLQMRAEGGFPGGQSARKVVSSAVDDAAQAQLDLLNGTIHVPRRPLEILMKALEQVLNNARAEADGAGKHGKLTRIDPNTAQLTTHYKETWEASSLLAQTLVQRMIQYNLPADFFPPPPADLSDEVPVNRRRISSSP